MRLVIIPRWAGTSADDFYPWLAQTVRDEHAERFDEVEVVDMPQPLEPDVGLWTAATRIAIGVAEQAARTVILGHSVGFQAVMRALAELEDDVMVEAAIGVAPWWRIDAPWPAIHAWIDTPFDHARVRTAARRIRCLVSDDDPFTRDYERTGRELVERIGAHVRTVPGGRHFNGAVEPEVLAELRATIA